MNGASNWHWEYGDTRSPAFTQVSWHRTCVAWLSPLLNWDGKINIHSPQNSTQGCYNLALNLQNTVYPKKYAHGYCFAVLCCGYTLTDFPISIRLTSLALWQSNDCPSASKANLMNMDKYFMWIHYERLHNHNKAKHNKTVCIFLGIYCRPLYCFVWCHFLQRYTGINRCVIEIVVRGLMALLSLTYFVLNCC